MRRTKGVRLPISLFRDGCGDVLVCIPYSGALALLSLSERLSWGSTWQDSQGRRIALSDSQQATVDATIAGLQDIMCINQLVEILEQIRDKIPEGTAGEEMIINNNVACGCGGCGCGGNSGGGGVDSQPPRDYVDPIPDETVEPPIPPYTETYAQYKCSASYVVHYDFRTLILGVDNLWRIGEATYEEVDEEIAATLGRANPAYVLLWEAYNNIVTFFGKLLSETTTYQIISEWDKAQKDVVCALYNSDGADDARARFKTVIDNLNLPWTSRYWLTLLEQNISYSGYLYPEDWATVAFPPNFVSRDCTHCGDSQEFTPELPDNATCLQTHEPDYYTLKADSMTVSVVGATCGNVSVTESQYDPISGKFAYEWQIVSGTCSQGSVTVDFDAPDNLGLDEVFAWLMQDVTIEGDVNPSLYLRGIPLPSEGDVGDLFWSSPSIVRQCFEGDGVTVSSNAQSINDNVFQSGYIVRPDSGVRRLRISGYLTLYAREV